MPTTIEKFKKGEVLSAAKLNNVRTAITEAQTNITNLQTNSATKSELTAATAGKFYGYVDASSNLPSGSADGYAYVGTAAPYAIWNFDSTNGWADSHSTLTNPVIAASKDTTSKQITITANGSTVTSDVASPELVDEKVDGLRTEHYQDIFDISEYHEDAVYVSLSDALGSSGANVPTNYRHGGMTIKFVQDNSNYSVTKEEGLETAPTGATVASSNPTSINNGTYKAVQLKTYFPVMPSVGTSVVYYWAVTGTTTTYTSWTISVPNSDNKYVQYRLMADTFSTIPSDWQGVDEVPIAGSKNLVESDGVSQLRGALKEYAETQIVTGVYPCNLIFNGTSIVEVSVNHITNGFYVYVAPGIFSIKIHIGGSPTIYSSRLLLVKPAANAQSEPIQPTISDGDYTYNTPQSYVNGVYIFISYNAGTIDLSKVSIYYTNFMKYTDNKVSEVSTDLNNLREEATSIIPFSIVGNVMSDGTFGTVLVCHRTGFTKINKFYTIYAYDGASTFPDYRALAFYSGNNTNSFISCLSFDTPGNKVIKLSEIEIPEGAEYFVSSTVDAQQIGSIQYINGNIAEEKVNNLVESISASIDKNSTNSQIPTSKAVFDNIDPLKWGKMDWWRINFGVYAAAGTTGAAREGMNCWYINVLPGDKFKVVGLGYYDTVFPLWMFKDINGNTLTKGTPSTGRSEGAFIEAPSDAFSLYVNIDGYIEGDGVWRLQSGSVVDDQLSLRGKYIVCFGDSNTQYSSSLSNLTTAVDGKRYSDWIEDLTGAKVINVGIGGTELRQRVLLTGIPTNTLQAWAALDMASLFQCIASGDYASIDAAAEIIDGLGLGYNMTEIAGRLKSIPWNKVSAITIWGGTNDWTDIQNGSLGETGSMDITTTLGAINQIVSLFSTKYKYIKMYFFNPCVRWYSNTAADRVDANWSDIKRLSSNKTLKEYAEAIYNEVKLNHVPICDFYNNMGWTKYNLPYVLGATDGVHYYYGYVQIAQMMVKFIEANRSLNRI